MDSISNDLEIVAIFFVVTTLVVTVLEVMLRNWRPKVNWWLFFQRDHPLVVCFILYASFFLGGSIARDTSSMHEHSLVYWYILPLALAIPITIANWMRARRLTGDSVAHGS
jgi:hypothetical protein